MSEKGHIMGKLELACRGCDFVLPYSGANKVQNVCSVPKWPVYGRARPSRRAFVENSPSKARIFVILPVYM